MLGQQDRLLVYYLFCYIVIFLTELDVVVSSMVLNNSRMVILIDLTGPVQDLISFIIATSLFKLSIEPRTSVI